MNLTTADILRLGPEHPWRRAEAADRARRGGGRAAGEAGAAGPKASKYHNQPVTVDGMRFDSKREAEHYGKLKLLQQAGEVAWFTRQVKFRLPGGVDYVADFVVKWKEGGISIQDAKGVRTKEYRIKARQMAAMYQAVEEV